MDTILNTVKKFIGGLTEENTDFDSDLINHINLSFSKLNQIGIGPKEGFFLIDGSERWDSFETDTRSMALVRMYVCVNAKITFDPPSSSSALESLKEQVKETEWRLENAGSVFEWGSTDG